MSRPTKHRSATLSSVFLSVILLWGAAARAEPESVLPEPGLTPRLKFHTGGSLNNAPEASPVLPDIPGEPSVWMVTEWSKKEMLRADAMSSGEKSPPDPFLGKPLYVFDTSTNESRVRIFRGSGEYVYELRGTGGWLGNAGGSNLFLATTVNAKDATFDRILDYRISLKLSEAVAIAKNHVDLHNGAVLAQVFTGFTLLLSDPTTHAKSSFFIQIPNAASVDPRVEYRGCQANGQNLNILSSHLFLDEMPLPFRKSDGPPTDEHFVLNRHLCPLVASAFQCAAADGRKFIKQLAEAAKDFRNWRLTSVYVGLETEDRDVRPSSTNTAKRGDVAVTLQLSKLSLTRDDSYPFSYADCAR